MKLPESGAWPLVIFIMYSKIISLCHYLKLEWIKSTQATFALVLRDIYILNKLGWTRCCFGTLAKVSVDIKIRIINKTPLVEKTDVQGKSKKNIKNTGVFKSTFYIRYTVYSSYLIMIP